MTFLNMWNTVTSIPGVKTGLILLLLSLIEVAPIKINPWSFIGGLIGRLLGIKAVSDKVDALDKKVDENQATTIRVRILRFEDDIQVGRSLSKDSWDQVMDDIDRYEAYTKENTKFKNNITVASINHIRKKYEELLEQRAWTNNLTVEDRR